MAANQGKSDTNDKYELFLKLFRQNEKKLYLYILSAVGARSVAEDVMQDTIVVMWRKFSEFQQGTSFSAWGITIARFLILDHFRKNHRSVVTFNSEALEKIMNSFANSDHLEDVTQALDICMEKLPENMKEIIRLRYALGLAIKDVALKIGKPIHGMYKQIAKIHFLLQGCIEKTLAAWDGS